MTELGVYYYRIRAEKDAKQESRRWGSEYVVSIETDGSYGQPRYRAYRMGRLTR